MCSQIWSLIAAIAAALLFTSFLERGWAELLLTKAQRRWTFLCTRFAAATAVYTVSVIVMLLILAAYYGRAGWELIPHGMWRSVLLITVSFAALTSTAVLLAFSRSGMALPIFGVFLQLILSSIFAQHEMLKRAIDSDLGRKAIDLAYWVIPKHSELERMANSAIRETPIINTPQLWCTVAYTLATLLVSIAWFQRKSF
jgi:ABC-type transport system involved in multi-copper enzyme maturation permease subunit